jgi:predicted nicotinamide N-methyase
MKRQEEKSVKTRIQAYGVSLLLSSHPEVRKLKGLHYPSLHGNKLWNSSWLLVDFFKRQRMPEGMRIMEVGCGWGLVGIYCAKRHHAIVTAVDSDKEVFPYLTLHAAINKVEINTMKRGFGGLKVQDLQSFDVLIGADICFWDNLALSLKRLISRALRAGVRMILIADPGRPPFNEVGEHFAETQESKILDWSIKRPRPITGRILQIGSLAN